jgi:hypothetical protein
MNAKDRIQLLQDNLIRVLNLISAVDSKASTIIAIDTAMLGALAVLIPPPTIWTTCIIVLSIVPTILLLMSLLLLSFSTFPRTKGPANSLLYFGAVSQYSLDDYQNAVNELTEVRYIQDLTEQCHRNSEIADQKHRWVRRSMILLYISIPFWLVVLYSFYQIKG